MANHIRSNLTAMTPLAMYKALARSVTDTLRNDTAGVENVQLQLGGISGQAEVLAAATVLDLVEFKVTDVQQ